MYPRPDRPAINLRRARRGAPDERGVTLAQLLSGIAVLGLLVLVVVAVSGSRSSHKPTPATVTPGLEPVLRTLNRDVSGTTHALLLDPNGCAHAKGQRAVVSFLADGSAPERASWYVETHAGRTVLVHHDCKNGHLESQSIVTAVNGTPLIACTPNCGHFETVRFSYGGPRGLTSVVAYRSKAPG